MSNLSRANFYKPQLLSFEMQQFSQTFICWFSGSYNISRVAFLNFLPFEVLNKNFRVKQSLSKKASSFYQTMSKSHLQLWYQKISFLHIQMNHWIVGNAVGFQNALRVRGVGYRFEISPFQIRIQAGYSHFLIQKLSLRKSIKSLIVNKKFTKLFFKGSNLMNLNVYVSTIRNLRRPDVYKGKGIRYQKDMISRKEGKKKKPLNLMSRLNQLLKKKRKSRKKKNKRPNLQKCPQKKATCLKVFVMTPRKPNSALRKVAWVLLSNMQRVHAYIPGMGGHTLQKHSVVLIRGGRVKDLPGMKYTIIRGKFDLKRIYDRRSAPSKYGAQKIYKRVDHRYRKYTYW